MSGYNAISKDVAGFALRLFPSARHAKGPGGRRGTSGAIPVTGPADKGRTMTLANHLPRIPQPPPFKTRPEILLHPNIPKPMHGLAPRAILRKEWWDETRKASYRSTGMRCLACGVKSWEAKEHQWLEGHELYKIDYPRGRMVYLETVPLCHYCHGFIHDGRLEALWHAGQATKEKYEAVMRHGQAILRAAKLKSPRPYNGPCAPWADWRLALFGKEYPPL